MSYQLQFGVGILSDYCDVLNVNRKLLPARQNFSKEIPAMNGSYYTGYKYSERVIEVEILVESTNTNDLESRLSSIKKILNSKNPQKLIISDKPDIYNLAVIDGEFDIDKIGKFSASFNITFVCHNPIEYSNKWNTFVPNNRSITTVNEGTTETQPIIDVVFKKKACFFQATNRKGETVLVGKPKELDKPVVPESDIVVEEKCQLTSGFTTLAQSLLPTGYETNGAGYGVGFNGEGIVATNYGSGSGWHGCAFRKSLGVDVNEFEVAIDFVISSQGQNYVAPPPQPDGGVIGEYKVVNCGGLWINSEPNDDTPIFAMSPNTIIYVTEIQGNWYKHTHEAKYGTYTGWSYGKYLQKVGSVTTRNQDYAESKVGTLEIYGFDRNGAKLFDSKFQDNSPYFEHMNPIVISGDEVLIKEDTIAGKSIRQEEVESGENVEYVDSASGDVGRWNDCTGKLVVRRERNTAGQYLWSATLSKYVNGALVETLTNYNALIASGSQSSLNYLGFFLGGYGTNAVVDVMTITNIKVRKLNIKTDENITSNISLFEAGDRLQVDFNRAEVLLNGQSIIEKLDIGSKFFDIPIGESDFVVRSDDETMIALAGIQQKYL